MMDTTDRSTVSRWVALLLKDSATLNARYMDDILRNIERTRIEQKLLEINSLHPSLKFTIEQEQDMSLPFLDMKIARSNGKVSSTWYTKPTDTGLTMNFHAVAPTKYKKSVVSGFVHRVYRACSSWKDFHISLTKAKEILENNQYPRNFYEPIIERTIRKIVEVKDNDNRESDEKDKN